MDHFGIGAALKATLQMYLRSARRSGRTTSLVDSVVDGDRIVFSNAAEAKRVARLVEERGVKITVLLIDPSQPEKTVFNHPTSEGRTIFDHGWVEAFYERAIEEAVKDIDHFQRESSGHGAAHRETARRAQEIAKWRT